MVAHFPYNERLKANRGMETQDGKTPEDKKIVTSQLRGETIAYAVQNGVYNLAANFVEPYISYQAQKLYSGHKRNAQYGNYTQNLAGEFAGDLIGCSALILAETMIPKQLHTFARGARGWVDPLYTSVAHRVFAREKAEPDYEQKVEQWKTFQERNLVRSLIMTTAGIAGNVATQKMMLGNPSPTGVVFTGKLLSATLTTAFGLGLRMAFPEKLKSVDNWMGRKIAPMLQEKHLTPASGPAPHADQLLESRKEPELPPSR